MGQVNKTRKNQREKYKITNWKSYNESLKNRGKITFWFDQEIQDKWYYSGPRKPGGKLEYSDIAIEFMLTIKCLYHLGYRQVGGFVESIILMGKIEELQVPSYTQIQRRSSGIEIDIRIRKGTKQNLDVVIDSTGLKVYGEGEWKVRKHGWNKHRTWRKIHVASDGKDLEIVSVVTTGNEVDDATAGIEVVEQIEESIGRIIGDGGYDKKKFREGISQQIEQIIPPQKNAVLSTDEKMNQRNEAIKSIEELGREKWKKEIGYHIRSKSEVNMFRYKMAFTEKMSSRNPKNEITEVNLKCKILNKFVAIGMPKSVKVA